MKTSKKNKNCKRGNALITTLGVMFLLTMGTGAYLDSSTQSVRISRRQSLEVQTTHLCEAGIQQELLNLWSPFKLNQNFVAMDTACNGASTNTPLATVNDGITNVGKFSVGVIKYTQPDTYTRIVTVRCVGFINRNANGTLNQNDPQKVVDVVAAFSLSRSKVFDYMYFINNYGWMDGFAQTDLVVNGDMRANGDFSFTNGTPTVNGSVYAAQNSQLVPAVTGLINTAPVKQTDSDYATSALADSRQRPVYNSSIQGAKGSNTYEQWRDYVFESNASIVNGRPDGATLTDSTGYKAWTKTTSTATTTTTLLDTTPSQQVTMPDLSDLTTYTNLSTTYVDTKATYLDGTVNPNFNTGAFVKVWNTTTASYQTVSTNGVVTGSAGLIGTAAHPVIIHGPVTFTQDIVIKGNVSGQGTLYAGRNVHIVGSIIYNNPPSFQGTDQTVIDQKNEKADLVGLAARGSVIMGDTSTFTTAYPLQYMSPPFTHARYDDFGNLIPAFNATLTDSTGFKKYQSVLGDAYIHSVASGVNQMDCVMYTNFVGGGDIGTTPGGVKMNGAIISKDEAMVVFSLPMKMNYDSRIRERNANSKPLIDINLPRSPVMLKSTWQDRGFFYGG
jgi:hypothetical protein